MNDDMPSVGHLTVPQLQAILRENQKYAVACEKILCIVGDKHPIAQIIKDVTARK